MYLKIITCVALIAMGIAGCSKESLSPTGVATPLPAVLTVTPGDGTRNVRLDAPIALKFLRSVDRVVVERDVHLISEQAMADSLCPDSSMISHGGMSDDMMDSSMIRHMAQVHASKGRFIWNGDSTECYFRPDSMMTPRTQYMLHMGSEMMQMMRKRMGDTGLMDGHSFGMIPDVMLFHFVTMDTSGAGAGHGHH